MSAFTILHNAIKSHMIEPDPLPVLKISSYEKCELVKLWSIKSTRSNRLLIEIETVMQFPPRLPVSPN